MYANLPNLLVASFNNKTFAPHFHDDYSIALITHGEHTFTCNKEIYQAKVGDIRLILKNATKEWEDSLMAENILEELIVNLIQSYSNKEFKQKKKIDFSSKKLHQAVEYMKENFNKNLKLERLSSLSGLSKYHFLRKFKEEFDMTPHAYLLQIRIQKAKNLLFRGYALNEIAYECGFSDQSHFTRVFNKVFGMSPKKLIM